MMPVLVAALLQQGLGILGNAVLAKGQQVVEDKLGVKLGGNLPPETVVRLKELEAQHEEWLMQATVDMRGQELQFQQAQEQGVSDRWKADMASDSWLAKNVRPAVLLYLLTAYSLFSLLSAFGVRIDAAYIQLLGQWGMLVMTAYFGGRSLEKIAAIRKGRQS